MKLCAEILFQHLKNTYNAVMEGPFSHVCCLGRPEFYMEDSAVFQAEHLYLATAEHLARRPSIAKNCTLICIGENMNLKYYRERLCLITIRSRADFFRVFQSVQNIFDLYDSWERTLYQDLAEDGSITKILADSFPVFNKPLTVLDKSFRVIASMPESYTASEWNVIESGALSSQSLESFMQESSLLTEKKGALHLDINKIRSLCVNLFSPESIYQGCLCISLCNEEFADAEDMPAEFLASILEKAIMRSPEMINDERTSVKTLFQTLISEMPLSAGQRWLLSAVNNKNRYVCVSMHTNRDAAQIPFGYISEIFEDTFPQSFALIKENEILGFICTEPLSDQKTGEFTAALNARLRTFLKQMHLYAGISDPFTELFDIRIHYAQAQCAVENGRLINPTDNLYWFSSYALMELIINSLGGLPAQAYFPAGFRALIEHDQSSGVSYLETLKVFLEENMSYTSASAKLYIHRSTLIDRIARIERDLKTDLNDPDSRLLLEILIKAIDIGKMLENR